MPGVDESTYFFFFFFLLGAFRVQKSSALFTPMSLSSKVMILGLHHLSLSTMVSLCSIEVT